MFWLERLARLYTTGRSVPVLYPVQAASSDAPRSVMVSLDTSPVVVELAALGCGR